MPKSPQYSYSPKTPSVLPKPLSIPRIPQYSPNPSVFLPSIFSIPKNWLMMLVKERDKPRLVLLHSNTKT